MTVVSYTPAAAKPGDTVTLVLAPGSDPVEVVVIGGVEIPVVDGRFVLPPVPPGPLVIEGYGGRMAPPQVWWWPPHLVTPPPQQLVGRYVVGAPAPIGFPVKAGSFVIGTYSPKREVFIDFDTSEITDWNTGTAGFDGIVSALDSSRGWWFDSEPVSVNVAAYSDAITEDGKELKPGTHRIWWDGPPLGWVDHAHGIVEVPPPPGSGRTGSGLELYTSNDWPVTPGWTGGLPQWGPWDGVMDGSPWAFSDPPTYWAQVNVHPNTPGPGDVWIRSITLADRTPATMPGPFTVLGGRASVSVHT